MPARLVSRLEPKKPLASGLDSTGTNSVRRVVFLVFPDHQPLDLAGPLQVFSFANRESAVPRYDLIVAAEETGKVASAAGPPLYVETGLDALKGADTLVVPGGPGVGCAAKRPALVAALRGAAQTARRTCSVCTGAFILAEAGLLAGRRATTHWRSCEALAEQYPDIAVLTDPIFVHDGSIWTSAGVTAGIDMTLALVEADHGHGLAARIARNLVIFLRRPGGQAQFSEPLAMQERAGRGPYGALLENITAAPQTRWTVETMAGFVGQSPRNFQRRFAAALGYSSADAVERVRVAHARLLLETTDIALAIVALRCGFGSVERMRRVFQRQFGTTPSTIRELFGRGTLDDAQPGTR